MNPLIIVLIPLIILFFLVLAFLIHMMRHLKHAHHHPLYEVPEPQKETAASATFVSPESLISQTNDTNPKRKEASVSEAVKPQRRRTIKAHKQKVSNKKKSGRAAKKLKTAQKKRKR